MAFTDDYHQRKRNYEIQNLNYIEGGNISISEDKYTKLKNAGIQGSLAGEEFRRLCIEFKDFVFIPANYLPENPIVDEVVKLSQQLPYKYDDVYQAWVAHGKDIEETKRCFLIEE